MQFLIVWEAFNSFYSLFFWYDVRSVEIIFTWQTKSQLISLPKSLCFCNDLMGKKINVLVTMTFNSNCFKYWSFSNKVFLKIKSLKKKKKKNSNCCTKFFSTLAMLSITSALSRIYIHRELMFFIATRLSGNGSLYLRRII